MTILDLPRQRVEPLHIWTPPRAGSLVVPVTKLATALGETLDDEQVLAADVLTSLNADGYPAKMAGGIIAARQNLKTYILERITMMFLLKPDAPGVQKLGLIVWSAHEFDTARETFNHFDQLIDEHPWLQKRVKFVHRGGGKEEICFLSPDGKQRILKFKARSKSGSRGLAGDIVVLDEGYALMPEHLGALIPILSTRRFARVYYGSSAGRAESGVLRDVRDLGRAGGAKAPAYVEWAAPKVACLHESCRHRPGVEPGCALDRRELIQMANPAVGRRISWEFIDDERTLLTPAEYARERLGWWDDPEGDAPVTKEMWARGVDMLSVSQGKPCYGVDAAPRLKSACIFAATWSDDGRPHVEIVAYGDGAHWLTSTLIAARKKNRGPVVMARNSPAVALLPDMMKKRIPVEMLPDSEMAAGCTWLEKNLQLDAEPGLVHLGDPIVDRALMGAAGRDSGDGGWLFVRKTSAADICPLVSLVGSLIGLRKLVRMRGTGSVEGGVG